MLGQFPSHEESCSRRAVITSGAVPGPARGGGGEQAAPGPAEADRRRRVQSGRRVGGPVRVARAARGHLQGVQPLPRRRPLPGHARGAERRQVGIAVGVVV